MTSAIRDRRYREWWGGFHTAREGEFTALRKVRSRPLTWLAPLATLSPRGRGEKVMFLAFSLGEKVAEGRGRRRGLYPVWLATATERWRSGHFEWPAIVKPGSARGYLLRLCVHRFIDPSVYCFYTERHKL